MKSPQLNKSFGNVLAKLRKDKGLSQELLGFESKLARNYISLLERGQRSPTLLTICQLASTLNIPESEIVRLTIIEVRNFEKQELVKRTDK